MPTFQPSLPFFARVVTLALLAASSARAQQPASHAARPTTVILVRHAERAQDGTRDPGLDSAGAARAMALRDVLHDAGVSAIYTTQFQRTRQTAQPLATQLGVTPAAVEAGGAAEQHAKAVAADILAKHAGKVVLAVGHSNTVPLIVRELGGSAPPQLADTEFDNLFIVTVPLGGADVTTIRARYGAPNPTPGGRM